MVREEQIDELCVRHYSDLNFRIRQIETGALYDDAIDVIPCRFTYEETDIPIDQTAIELSAEEALQIICGEVNV